MRTKSGTPIANANRVEALIEQRARPFHATGTIEPSRVDTQFHDEAGKVEMKTRHGRIREGSKWNFLSSTAGSEFCFPNGGFLHKK